MVDITMHLGMLGLIILDDFIRSATAAIYVRMKISSSLS
jgi:hypothetical protein